MSAAYIGTRPAYMPMEGLKQNYGIAKTLGYELLNKGAIRARKVGRKTLIEIASVDEFMERQAAYGKAA